MIVMLLQTQQNKKQTLNLTHPELAKEWHPYKNECLFPENITPGSGKKVWWLGRCGHEWESCIHSRTRQKTGCPYCANQKVLEGFNDLATKHPQLAKEWHPTKNEKKRPNEVIYGSNQKVWWQCGLGHEWLAQISSRCHQKTGCPYCSGHKAWKGFNDLATVNPELAKQWHPTRNGDLTPYDVLPSTSETIWWLGECGHEWSATLNNRTKKNGKQEKNKCPYCANQKILKGFNDLATSHPHLAKEWHPTKNFPLTPTTVIGNNNKKVWWQCELGHEWMASIHNRKRNSCPDCQKANQTSFPEQAFYFYLKMIFPDAINTYKLKIQNKSYEVDIYIPSINLGIEYDGYHWHKPNKEKDTLKNSILKDKMHFIRIREEGLPIFRNVKCFNCSPTTEGIKQTLTQLLTYIQETLFIDKEIKENIEAILIDPQKDEVKIKSNFIFKHRKNSLYKKNERLAKEWHPSKNGTLTPHHFSLKSNFKAWWKCEKGHEWQSKICNRAIERLGCPYCSGRFVTKGETDLATTNPELAKEWHPSKNDTLTPKDVSKGSNKKVWWRCELGHEWLAQVNNRCLQKTGCPYCSGRKAWKGFNDLKTKNPKLAKEWHPTRNGDLTPCDVLPSTHRTIWWLGTCGHEWIATLNNRSKGKGCPICYKLSRSRQEDLK